MFNAESCGPLKSSLTATGKLIDLFDSLSESSVRFLEKRYQRDLEYFGYSWQFSKSESGENRMFTSCVHGGGDKMCC